jgi:hypothetical protein
MPWKTNEFTKLVKEAKSLVASEFNIPITELDCPVYITGQEELQQAILDELELLHYSKNAIQKIKVHFLSHVIGKYFRLNDEIWVLQGKGNNIDTIVHELLHSIQRCEPNREGIVDFLTYMITGNSQYIDTFELEEWQEIEKMVTYHQIKMKLTSEGDCEDF